MLHKKTFILLATFAILVPSITLAASVVRTGDAVSIEEDQKIEGDFYAASNVVSISGEVTEDALLIGGRTTLNGKVGKDALIGAASVDVHGLIGEDLRIIAGDVIIAEPVSGDVFVIADTVKILSTASIGGDLIIYASTAEVGGSVGGKVVGTAESLRLDASVGKGVDVTTQKLTLGDRAAITDTVRYTSAEELVRSPNATVGGEITRSDVPVKTENEMASVRQVLIGSLVLLFSALSWFLVGRAVLVDMTARSMLTPVRSLLIGFVTLFAAPVVFGVLTVSVIGTVVGLIGLLLYGAAVLAAIVGMAAVLGTRLMTIISNGKDTVLTPYTILVGVTALTILFVIPIIGPVIIFIACIVALGSLVDLLLRPNSVRP